jgi:hypothetical protein
MLFTARRVSSPMSLSWQQDLYFERSYFDSFKGSERKHKEHLVRTSMHLLSLVIFLYQLVSHIMPIMPPSVWQGLRLQGLQDCCLRILLSDEFILLVF